MNLRKNMVLVVGGSIALVLLLLFTLLLFRFHGKYADARSNLKNGQTKMKRLANRDPYPSQENLEIARKNLAVMSSLASNLLENLSQGQVEPESMEPGAFSSLLEDTIRRLLVAADQAKVLLPAEFAFGFDRFRAGALPETEHIPRLVYQLKIIEELCVDLFDSKISELLSIERKKFDEEEELPAEEPSSRRSRRRPRGDEEPKPSSTSVAGTNDIYGVERITLGFRGRENSLWDTLDIMAGDPLFVVVKSVELQSEVPEIERAARNMAKELSAIEATTGSKPKPQSREDRVVAGREEVLVKMVCDVMHFKDEQEAEESAE